MPILLKTGSKSGSVSGGGVTFVDANTAVGRRRPVPRRVGGSFLQIPPFNSPKFQEAFGPNWKIPSRPQNHEQWQGVRLDTKKIHFRSYVRGMDRELSGPVKIGRVTHFEVGKKLTGEDVVTMATSASLEVLGLPFFLALDWDRKTSQQSSILAHLHADGVDSLAIIGDVLEDGNGNRAIPAFNCDKGLWSPRFIRLSLPWFDGHTKAIPLIL